jgi:hypothetical protein
MNKHDSGLALILLVSVGYDDAPATQHLLPLYLFFHSNWGWNDLGFFQLLQLNSSPEEV